MLARREIAARRSQSPVSRPFSIAAPTGGWASAFNLAASPPDTAAVLENWIPTTTGITMRAGSLKHATVSDGAPCESLMAYVGMSRRLFAAADGNIFDVTLPDDPGVMPVAAVSGQQSNYYSHINMVNQAGGQFLMVANGTDDIQAFDGSSWFAIMSGTAPMQINGVQSSDISHLNNYRNRVWMVEAGTMNAWYLPTDAISGTANRVPLAGVFRNGGALLFSATWSLDAGDGLDDKIVFVSTEGEVAVYQGDPAGGDFSLVGLYDCSPPMGKNAFMKVAGDLLIETEIGFVPLSQITNKDPAALALAAVSRKIQPDWQKEARERRGLPWEVVKWTSRNIAYVTCPMTAEENVTPPICFAVNLETGAWCKITGWDTRCMTLHNDRVFFGTSDGRVLQADITGSDDGQLIYYTYVGQPDHLGAPGQQKTLTQARAVFRTLGEFEPRISVTTDYSINLPSFPDASMPVPASLWDQGLWDQNQWDAGVEYYTVQTRFVSIGRTGFVHAPVLLVTSGSLAAPSAELVTFDLVYQTGNLVA